MREMIVVALLVTVCGGRDIPPPAARADGGTIYPVADAGAGDCADDFHATRILCNGLPDDRYRACVLAADDRFEGCLPPDQECAIRCTDEHGVRTPEDLACRAACPIPDAG